MEDKYYNIDAKKFVNEVVDGIIREKENSFDINDDAILEGIEDGEFSLIEEMGLKELEDFIVNDLWSIESNYVQLRAIFLKLYKLRNHPNLLPAERSEIDRLIELIFNTIDSTYTECAEKAAEDAENLAAKSRR